MTPSLEAEGDRRDCDDSLLSWTVGEFGLGFGGTLAGLTVGRGNGDAPDIFTAAICRRLNSVPGPPDQQ